MKLTYPVDQVHNPLQILRSAGYQYFVDPKTKKESYILRLTSEFYPRFHLYVKQDERNIIFDLHLDQKKPSYQGTRAHGGEYDGPTVEKEMDRIAGWIQHVTGIPSKQPATHSTHQKEEDLSSIPTQHEEKPIETSSDLFRGIFG